VPSVKRTLLTEPITARKQ